MKWTPPLYILDDEGNLIKETDLKKWSAWMQSADKTIAKDEVGEAVIATAFLGMTNKFTDAPSLFETTITGGKKNGFKARYDTKEEALEGHKAAVAIAHRCVINTDQ